MFSISHHVPSDPYVPRAPRVPKVLPCTQSAPAPSEPLCPRSLACAPTSALPLRVSPVVLLALGADAPPEAGLALALPGHLQPERHAQLGSSPGTGRAVEPCRGAGWGSPHRRQGAGRAWGGSHRARSPLDPPGSRSGVRSGRSSCPPRWAGRHRRPCCGRRCRCRRRSGRPGFPVGRSHSLQAGSRARGAQPAPPAQVMPSWHLIPQPKSPTWPPSQAQPKCTIPTLPLDPDRSPLPSPDPGHSLKLPRQPQTSPGPDPSHPKNPRHPQNLPNPTPLYNPHPPAPPSSNPHPYPEPLHPPKLLTPSQTLSQPPRSPCPTHAGSSAAGRCHSSRAGSGRSGARRCGTGSAGSAPCGGHRPPGHWRRCCCCTGRAGTLPLPPPVRRSSQGSSGHSGALQGWGRFGCWGPAAPVLGDPAAGHPPCPSPAYPGAQRQTMWWVSSSAWQELPW